jgi:hypothetical protein
MQLGSFGTTADAPGIAVKSLECPLRYMRYRVVRIGPNGAKFDIQGDAR